MMATPYCNEAEWDDLVNTSNITSLQVNSFSGKLVVV